MNVSALTLRELMDGSRNFIDTVWEISLTEDSVFIVHDSMTPDLAETRRPYSELFHLYADTCVYPPDRARWDALLSWDALCGMPRSMPMLSSRPGQMGCLALLGCALRHGRLRLSGKKV